MSRLGGSLESGMGMGSGVRLPAFRSKHYHLLQVSDSSSVKMVIIKELKIHVMRIKRGNTHRVL